MPYDVGVVVPLEADILYGAYKQTVSNHQPVSGSTLSNLPHPGRLTKTCLALQILQASFLTLPSAGTTAGANSTPNI